MLQLMVHIVTTVRVFLTRFALISSAVIIMFWWREIASTNTPLKFITKNSLFLYIMEM